MHGAAPQRVGSGLLEATDGGATDGDATDGDATARRVRMPTFLLLTHPGQANPNSNPNPNQAKALVTGGCINIEMFPRRSMLKPPPSAVSAPPELPTISWHRLGSAPAPPHGCASDSTAF
eukprot:scaffold24628_cov43-Phaeocystis_antarctica.AAC.2